MATVLQSAAGLVTLSELLSVSRDKYHECIDTVAHKHTISGVTATTRLHHLRFDANGQPMIKALTECLYLYLMDYCIAARNRPDPLSGPDAMRLAKDARKLFIHPPSTEDDPDQTGEAGEMLLFLLMEAVLGAPQVVAKMELKTNRSMEVHGSDGIHMAWDPIDEVVEVYFGEAKLYQDVGAAMTNALKSVEAFHAAEMCRHEFRLVTKQFKQADPEVQAAVTDLLRDGVPTQAVRINHALLIGYNWAEYGTLPSLAQSQLVAEFKTRYLTDAPRLHALLQSRFDSFSLKHLRFEVFFMPFTKVQDFRDAFNAALD